MLQRQKQHTEKLKVKRSDLFVTKDGVGLDVRGATTDILSDCPDRIRLTDADTAEIEDIVWLKVAVLSWDATKNEKRTCVRFSNNCTKKTVLNSWNTFLDRIETLIYAIQYCSKF